MSLSHPQWTASDPITLNASAAVVQFFGFKLNHYIAALLGEYSCTESHEKQFHSGVQTRTEILWLPDVQKMVRNVCVQVSSCPGLYLANVAS